MRLAADIYDFARARLWTGAEPERILGVGHSLGAMTTEYMAFGKNKRFTKIANTGILTGNVYEGCRRGSTQSSADGIRYSTYSPNATTASLAMLFDFTTTTRRGCTNVEISPGYGFASYPYRNNPVELGLFEGLNSGGNGHVPQANIIKSVRDPLSVITEVHGYGGPGGTSAPQCGHNIYNTEYSNTQALSDIIDFLRN